MRLARSKPNGLFESRLRCGDSHRRAGRDLFSEALDRGGRAMIARVQFRPSSEWPWTHREMAEKLCGLWIEIDTDSMIHHLCGGRGWLMTAASSEMTDRI